MGYLNLIVEPLARAPRFIIQCAARRVRDENHQGLEEEWLAHLLNCQELWAQFTHAFGCYRASFSFEEVKVGEIVNRCVVVGNWLMLFPERLVDAFTFGALYNWHCDVAPVIKKDRI